MGTQWAAQGYFMDAQPVNDAPGFDTAKARHPASPVCAASLDVGHQIAQGVQPSSLEPHRQLQVQPGAQGVCFAGRLGDQCFEPTQGFELPLQQALAASLVGEVGFVVGFVGGHLFGLGVVLQASFFRKCRQAGQRLRGLEDLLHIHQHEPGGARTSLAQRRRRELVADPLQGGAHQPQVHTCIRRGQVTLPAMNRVEAFQHRTHESEVGTMQRSTRARLDQTVCGPGRGRRGHQGLRAVR